MQDKLFSPRTPRPEEEITSLYPAGEVEEKVSRLGGSRMHFWKTGDCLKIVNHIDPSPLRRIDLTSASVDGSYLVFPPFRKGRKYNPSDEESEIRELLPGPGGAEDPRRDRGPARARAGCTPRS